MLNLCQINENAEYDITIKEFHESAMALLHKSCKDYSDMLVIQAKIIAHRQRAEIVLYDHVSEAKKMINDSRKRNTLKKIILTIGGAFLGAFVSGFINEFYTQNYTLLIVYTVLGFIGLFFVFWGVS